MELQRLCVAKGEPHGVVRFSGFRNFPGVFRYDTLQHRLLSDIELCSESSAMRDQVELIHIPKLCQEIT
jgi:hypothetical protein